MPIDSDKLSKIRAHFDRWFPGYADFAELSETAVKALCDVVEKSIKLSNVEQYCVIIGCTTDDAHQVKKAYQTFINYVAETNKMRSVPPPAQKTKIPQQLLFSFLAAISVPLIQQSTDELRQAIRSFLLEDEIDDVELTRQIQALFDQIGAAIDVPSVHTDTLEDRVAALEDRVAALLTGGVRQIRGTLDV